MPSDSGRVQPATGRGERCHFTTACDIHSVGEYDDATSRVPARCAREIFESEFGLATVYEWSDTKFSAIDFGYAARAFSPYSPSMTLARTGIDKEQFQVHYDAQGIVRTVGFIRHEGAVPVLWFWPF